VDRKAIYRKTPKGLTEITAKDRTVDRRLRPLLILVDGFRTATYIHSLIGATGIREEDFDDLIAGGFIEAIAVPAMEAANDPDDSWQQSAPSPIPKRSSYDRYADGKRYLCETAVDNLGLRSFLFVLKLEKCASSEDLMALLPEFEQAISRKVDKDYARHCRQIAASLLQN
jgi:hypothetical protein